MGCRRRGRDRALAGISGRGGPKGLRKTSLRFNRAVRGIASAGSDPSARPRKGTGGFHHEVRVRDSRGDGALLLSSPSGGRREELSAVGRQPRVAAESPSAPGAAHLMVARDPVTPASFAAPTAARAEALRPSRKKLSARVGEPTLSRRPDDGFGAARPGTARFSVAERAPTERSPLRPEEGSTPLSRGRYPAFGPRE